MSGYTTQMSLFGVPLAGPGEVPTAARPRKRRPPQAPLRNCRACGGRFRSWSDERYCPRAECIERRGSGLGLDDLDPCQIAGGYDPATAPWPEGF